MKKLVAVICVLLAPALALSQEKDFRAAGRGYAFVAPGVVVGDGSTSGFLHFGGGGELRLAKGFGVGSELGYLAPFQYMNMGVGVFSLNGFYNFEKTGAKVAPFVTGGYSLLFRSGHANAINFGGGIDYWFREKVGIRFEFRDHFSAQYLADHLLQGRFGIVFR